MKTNSHSQKSSEISLREKYAELNDSFDESLAYGMGIHGGLFSEVNLLIFTMVYCLKHKLKFVPHSGRFGPKTGKGWGDYFEYFYPEVIDANLDRLNTKSKTQHKFNPTKPRRMWRSLKYALAISGLKKKHGIKYLSFDLWNKIYDRGLESASFNIPELGIDGDFQEACRVIARMVWNFNPKVRAQVDAYAEGLDLPDAYVGMQIRRGDKHIEAELLGAERYIGLAQSNTAVRSAFVLTDDYGVIEELEKGYPAWRFYTLCRPHERGYVHREFILKTKEEIYQSTVQLIASVEILRQSRLFIGTFSANPGMFLGMLMNREQTISLDVPFQIFGGKEAGNQAPTTG